MPALLGGLTRLFTVDIVALLAGQCFAHHGDRCCHVAGSGYAGHLVGFLGECFHAGQVVRIIGPDLWLRPASRYFLAECSQRIASAIRDCFGCRGQFIGRKFAATMRPSVSASSSSCFISCWRSKMIPSASGVPAAGTGDTSGVCASATPTSRPEKPIIAINPAHAQNLRPHLTIAAPSRILFFLAAPRSELARDHTYPSPGHQYLKCPLYDCVAHLCSAMWRRSATPDDKSIV